MLGRDQSKGGQHHPEQRFSGPVTSNGIEQHSQRSIRASWGGGEPGSRVRGPRRWATASYFFAAQGRIFFSQGATSAVRGAPKGVLSHPCLEVFCTDMRKRRAFSSFQRPRGWVGAGLKEATTPASDGARYSRFHASRGNGRLFRFALIRPSRDGARYCAGDVAGERGDGLPDRFLASQRLRRP
jgi:hypothetical protein